MGAGGRVRRAGSRAVREDEGREHLAIRGAKGPAGARRDAGSRGRGLSGTRGERKRRRAGSEAATEAQEETYAGRSGQCGRGHLGKGRSGLTGSRNPRNVLPRAQEIGTADRPMVERLELVLTWGGRFSEEDRGADHTAAI